MKATDFGAGLVNLGLPQKNDTRVGIYSQNRPEVSGIVTDILDGGRLRL